MQRTGGIAALYVAVAYLAAIPYFVLIVDYPSATDPVSKVALLKDNFTSMYLMHVVCFQLVALAMIVVCCRRRGLPAGAFGEVGGPGGGGRAGGPCLWPRP